MKAIETHNSKTIKQHYTFEMRLTIEDGVYKLLAVKIESMFDNRKGRMIHRTDIFSSCGYAGEFGGGSKTSK